VFFVVNAPVSSVNFNSLWILAVQLLFIKILVILQMQCAEHDKDKELLSQQSAQIAGLENAKSWLERRLCETEVCFNFFSYLTAFLC